MSIALREPTVSEPEAEFAPGMYRLSVEQYLDMARMGILTTDDRVELLEGVLVAKMTKYPPHVLSTRLIMNALEGVVPAGWFVAKEDPIATSDSVPEPDCAVVRGTIRDYASRHPGSGEMAMVVEVADSSLGRDRGFKRRIYARAAIPIYWLANLVESRIEVYSDPTGPASKPEYRAVQVFGPDDAIPVVIDGREVARLAVRDLLP